MKLYRTLQVALFGAFLFTRALAQTEADIAALLPKAQRGNAIAQYRLGVAYSTGQGIATNPIEAYIWLSLAYENGFRGKALGNVAGALDPAQLETARAQLAERRASLNPKPATAPAAEAEIPVVRTSSAPPAALPAPAPAATPALAQELATAITDKQQLSSELSKSWAETEELKKQLAEIQATADFLTGETSKLRAERDGLATKEDALAKDTVLLRTQRDQARELGEQADKALAQTNSQKAALESSFKAAQASAATDKKWLTDELTKSFQEVSGLKSQLAALNQSIAATPAPVAYPNLSGKVKELEASLAALVTEANATKQEAARLSDERIDREKQLIAVQQQAATLADKNTLLQQEADKLRQAAATPVAPAYPDLREQVASLENQLSTLKAQSSQQFTALTQAKDSAEKSLAQHLAVPAVPDLSGKVRELETSLAALSTAANATKQQASTLAEQNAALQQETEALRKTTATPATPAYPDLREQVAALTGQLEAAKTELGQSSLQISALTQAKEAAEKSIAQGPATPSYPDLSGKVQELGAALSALTTEANAVKQEAARLSEERIEREKHLIALQQQAESLTQAKEAAEKSLAQSPNAPAYPDLSGKVQELTNANVALNSESNAASKTIEDLRQAKTEADKKLAVAEQTRTELAQQFDEFKRSALANQREHLSLQSKIQMLESEKAALRQQTAADQTRLADLSSQLAASRRQATEVYPTAPSYPDQRARVGQLEAELTKTNEQANSMVSLLNQSQQEAKESAAQAEQLRVTIRTLENKIAAVDRTPTYPDLRPQVAGLETALAAAKSAAPAYPDLREQVSNLEIQLEAARNLPKLMIPAAEHSKTKQELADTKEKLGTTLRGYAVLEKERDELAKRPATTASAPVPAYPDLRHQVATLETALAAAKSERGTANQSEIVRLNEAYAALQRANAQSERDLAAVRAQLQQLPSSAPVAAIPTSPVSTTPVAAIPVGRPVTKPTIAAAPATPSAPVVAAAAPAVRRTHIVAGGDSLTKLSQRYYGTDSRWREIYNANRDVIGANGALRAGSELRIP